MTFYISIDLNYHGLKLYIFAVLFIHKAVEERGLLLLLFRHSAMTQLLY